MGYRSLYLECEAQPTRASDAGRASADTASSSRTARWAEIVARHIPPNCATDQGIRISPQECGESFSMGAWLLIRPISFVYRCFASILSRETVLSDFPHSRQTRLARGVISPQNGHILCDRTSWVRGRKLASNFPRNSRREARRRWRGGRYGSIRFHLCGGLG